MGRIRRTRLEALTETGECSLLAGHAVASTRRRATDVGAGRRIVRIGHACVAGIGRRRRVVADLEAPAMRRVGLMAALHLGPAGLDTSEHLAIRVAVAGEARILDGLVDIADGIAVSRIGRPIEAYVAGICGRRRWGRGLTGIRASVESSFEPTAAVSRRLPRR